MMASLKPSQINGAKTKWVDKVGGIPHKVGGQSGGIFTAPGHHAHRRAGARAQNYRLNKKPTPAK